MRDPALDRDWYEFAAERNRLRGLPPYAGRRCPVCLTAYIGVQSRYSTGTTSPLGREMYTVTCKSHYCRSRAQEFAFWPVDQTRFGSGGNCFSACVAMLLELRIDDVPYFMTGADWWHAFETWLRERRFAPIWHDRRGEIASKPAPDGFNIKSGQSPRFPGRYHSVLAYRDRVVHDPHVGDRRGVTDVIDYITLERIK